MLRCLFLSLVFFGFEPVVVAQPGESLSSSARYEHLRWTHRVAQSLRDGRGLTSADPIDALASLSRRDVIQHFLRDPLFADSLFKFHLHYIGEATAQRGGWYNDSYHPDFLLHQPSIRAALAGLNGENYLEALWSNSDRIYFPAAAPVYDAPEGLPQESTQAERRAHLMRLVRSKYDELLRTAEQTPGFQPALCANSAYLYELNKAGMPFALITMLANDLSWLPQLTLACGIYGPNFFPLPSDFVARLKSLKPLLETLIATVPQIGPEYGYLPRRLTELKSVHVEAIGGHSAGRFFGGYPFGLQHPANFSNAHRHRAAFVLKQYFCDDLTPVPLESAPGGDGEDAHLSQPECQSCHYKLDPMAALLRESGHLSQEFSWSKYILLSDFYLPERTAYAKNWQNADGTIHAGFMRSLTVPTRNEYGQSEDDLLAILRRVPESRTCLVRRMFDYFVRPGQLVDDEFLREVSRPLLDAPVANSSAAMREVLTRFLLSKAFEQENPRSDVCYDRPEGHVPGEGLPCVIAGVVRASCVTCHNADRPLGGLDMSRWVTVAGQPQFIHKETDGSLLSWSESSERIVARLESRDVSVRMPRGVPMNDQDRARLIQWVRSQP